MNMEWLYLKKPAIVSHNCNVLDNWCGDDSTLQLSHLASKLYAVVGRSYRKKYNGSRFLKVWFHYMQE